MDRNGRDGTCFRRINYKPLPSQKRFHDCPARFKGFSGPIGSGKSAALCHEAIRMTYVNPGRTGLIGAPTYPMLRDATQLALFEILDTNGLPYKFNKSENTLIMSDTRSKILFRSVDEFDRLRGTNLAWFGLDELTYTQEKAWLLLQGRLRDPKAKELRGFAVWTPKGYDWVYQRFLAEPSPGTTAIIAAAFENRYLLSQVPDFYERLRTSYDEQFYGQEVLGSYLSAQGGVVYQAFDRNQNVAELKLDPTLPLLWALDFNVDPMSSLIVQFKRHEVFVLDEIVIRRATTRQACEEFRKRFPSHDAGVVIYGDASGFHMQTTGSSDYQLIREFFGQEYPSMMRHQVPRSNPQVRDRIALTNAKLRNAAGETDLLIDRKCKELIKDLEQVAYREDSTDIDKNKDRKRTHMSDALGYLLWQECRPGRASMGQRNERLF
jgi:hypothetical protein